MQSAGSRTPAALRTRVLTKRLSDAARTASRRGERGVGPYVLVRLGVAGSSPARPGSSSCSRRPGGCCRGRSASASRRPVSSASSSIRSAPARARSRALAPRDEIAVTGPLGQGYDLAVERPLLVGGGIGVAPLPVPLGAARRARRRSSASARAHHAEAAALVPNAEVVLDPTLVTEALPADPGDVLACGPEPMLDALERARAGRAARPRGADGLRLRRLLRLRRAAERRLRPPVRRRARAARGMSASRILNASGCLDALAAPEVARSLDAFVTKTITPLPREGNPPVRIAETEHGMLELDRAAGARHRRVRRRATCRGSAALGTELWVSVGGFSATDFARVLRATGRRASTSRRSSSTSRARTSTRRRRPRRSSSPPPAPRRGSRSTRSFPLLSGTSPRRRGRSSRPGPTGSRSSTRSAGSRSTRSLRPRLARAAGGYSGPALKPIALACVHACASAVDVPIVGMGGVRTGLDALELVAAGAGSVALGTVLFADPLAPGRIRAELEAEAAARGYRRSARCPCASPLSDQKNLCKLRKTVLLDSRRRGC